MDQVVKAIEDLNAAVAAVNTQAKLSHEAIQKYKKIASGREKIILMQNETIQKLKKKVQILETEKKEEVAKLEKEKKEEVAKLENEKKEEVAKLENEIAVLELEIKQLQEKIQKHYLGEDSIIGKFLFNFLLLIKGSI
jgi:chromosome segregation ATPase